MGNYIDYEKGFAVGDVLKVRNCFMRIKGKDSIRIYKDFDSTATGVTSSDTSIDELNPKYGTEIYQIVQVVPSHNVQVFVKQPASTLRWGTNLAPSIGFVSDRISSYDGGETNNIFITNYQQPVLQVKNTTLKTISAPRVFFFGWKYQIEELKDYSGAYTPVQYGGFD